MPDARFWQDLGRLGLGQISFTSFDKFRKQNIVICGLYDKSHELVCHTSVRISSLPFHNVSFIKFSIQFCIKLKSAYEDVF